MNLFSFFKNKIYLALVLLVTTLLLGVFGYRFIADYNWVDAVYMTVITITTVGFGEVIPLTPEAKIFTVILILLSVVIVGYALTVISEYIISKSSYKDLIHKKVQQEIDKMTDHIIVCGYGRNGQEAVQKLMAYNKQFVVIEMDLDVIERYEMDKNIHFVNGNANEDEILEKAGITRASALLCALPEDADNLFIVLSARQLNSKLKIISRATAETSQKKLKLAGADNVIMPDKIGGDHMASLVVVPDLIEFLDNLSVVGEEDSINVEEISFDQICADGKEASIKEIDLRYKTGCTIIGYRSPSGKYIVNPEADMRLEKESKLIVIGRPEQIKRLHETFGI
ncbi:potassium channel protein [Dokdonia sp. Dokd-P16]|uniref:potassium channel family protein n=1 Tax=Dokdonia sp. Dokd-P16 TaxID=2173169 RepID=UPI000D5495FA|nr:potassium channel protein [Dokdonia sp. Dokd-P16]AWH74514.1 potassium channel protein [Dokdonia sp. Dokd-P16]